MQHFKLPAVEVETNKFNNLIFFSCDVNYYELYGKALIKSILGKNSWLGVHCHIIIKDTSIQQYTDPRVSYSFEYIDNKFIETINFQESTTILSKYDAVLDAEKTYYACARFMQMDKIFPDDSKRILQVDCDSLLFKDFPKIEFEDLTNHVRAMRKPKSPEKIIASCLSLGSGTQGLDFRKQLSLKLFNEFSTKAYWFIDQIVLQEVFENIQSEPIPLHWNHWSFKKPYAYFRTGKGNKKSNNDVYLRELKKWNNL